MSPFAAPRYALSIAAVALLAACAGSQPPIATRGTAGTTPSFSHYRFFSYTGGKQSFKVPADVTHLTITLYGANGALGNVSCCSGFASSGGSGGTVTATIPVTPGERLSIFVGGSGGRGGFNGGAGVDAGSCGCGRGGGASDVRLGHDRLADRVLVAGGGGGGGTNGYNSSGTNDGGYGGYGGARKGGPGAGGSDTLAGGGGGGGIQKAGGTGGNGGEVYGGSSCNGSDGALGVGGAGGAGRSSGCGGAGGGGGGGYYGGGGGGAGGSDLTTSGSGPRGSGGGGGGGSSFAEARARHVKMADGGNPTHDGDGSIIVFW